MRYAALALGVVLLLTGQVAAQDPWLNKLFPGGTSHDFGTVPRGAQLKFRFAMKNPYKVPLEISEPRVSCGCVTCKLSTKVFQPNETGYLDINMDARRFNGSKTVQIYLTSGPEYISTANLRVSAVARQDVVFNPGQVDFGIVQAGKTPTEVIDVEYSGTLDWRITEVIKNSNAPFGVSVDELYRERSSRFRPGRVGYRFNVTLKADVPAGPFKQEIILKTNDPASPTLTVAVEGTIQASLMARPTVVQLGDLKVGEVGSSKVLVRGSRAFRILGVDGQGDGLMVDVPNRQAASQVITVRYQPTKTGAIKRQLRIRTDLDGESVTVTVEANGTP